MSDKLQRAYREAEDRLSSMMREMHERGELRHLQGKQLSLEEDDPAWLATRMLKQEGFSHPLLERRRDVEHQISAADAGIDRLVQRRSLLLEDRATASPERVGAFNVGRELALQDYRESIAELNRAIRDYNLTVPLPLHIVPVQIEPQMQRVERLVPPLDVEDFGQAGHPRVWWMQLLRRRRS